MYQRIGFQCFNETLFEEAGKNLFNGDTDPRLLISYYPHLRGQLFAANDRMEVFAGVAEHMPTDVSVDDISESFFFTFLAPPDSRHSPFFLFRLIFAAFPFPPLTSSLSLPQCHNVAPLRSCYGTDPQL